MVPVHEGKFGKLPPLDNHKSPERATSARNRKDNKSPMNGGKPEEKRHGSLVKQRIVKPKSTKMSNVIDH